MLKLDLAAWGTCCKGEGTPGLAGPPGSREHSPEGRTIPHLSGHDQPSISLLS